MKAWGEMNDEEQGKLLLAHHRGEVIEIWADDIEDWWIHEGPSWVPGCSYRVKKEPVIEVVHREVRVVEANEYIMTIAHDATCTYTDGKLTKIHWEAGE